MTARDPIPDLKSLWLLGPGREQVIWIGEAERHLRAA